MEPVHCNVRGSTASEKSRFPLAGVRWEYDPDPYWVSCFDADGLAPNSISGGRPTWHTKPNIQQFVARLQLGLLRPDLYGHVALAELLRIYHGPSLSRKLFEVVGRSGFPGFIDDDVMIYCGLRNRCPPQAILFRL